VGAGGTCTPTFWSWGTVPHFLDLSQLRDDYSRVLQRLTDSLARFVGERARKGAKKGKWRRQGKERHIWYPYILAQSDASGLGYQIYINIHKFYVDIHGYTYGHIHRFVYGGRAINQLISTQGILLF